MFEISFSPLYFKQLAERKKFDYNIKDLFMTYGGSQHGVQQSFCILLCLYLRVLTFLKMFKFIKKKLWIHMS